MYVLLNTLVKDENNTIPIGCNWLVLSSSVNQAIQCDRPKCREMFVLNYCTSDALFEAYIQFPVCFLYSISDVSFLS